MTPRYERDDLASKITLNCCREEELKRKGPRAGEGACRGRKQQQQKNPDDPRIPQHLAAKYLGILDADDE